MLKVSLGSFFRLAPLEDASDVLATAVADVAVTVADVAVADVADVAVANVADVAVASVLVELSLFAPADDEAEGLAAELIVPDALPVPMLLLLPLPLLIGYLYCSFTHTHGLRQSVNK